MLLLTPIFAPIITKLAPVGPAMFAVCTILDTPMEESTTESLPFIAMICFIIRSRSHRVWCYGFGNC